MLVKKTGPTEAYQCEKCGNAYTTREKALLCESNPVSPFKYEMDDVVLFNFESRLTRKRFTIRGVVTERRIHGLSKGKKPTHTNLYKLKILDQEKGLVVFKTEDEILRKI